MASRYFRGVQLPSGDMFSVPGPSFGHKFSKAGGAIGSALSIGNAVTSAVDFFTSLDKYNKPTAEMRGMSGTERAAYDKRQSQQLTFQGIDMGLQILASILSFV